jgi:CBS domain-containing protein
MNLQAPVSSLMSTNLITVEATDKLQVAKDIFGTHNIHHLPVLDENEKLVGIFSKSDYLYFIRPLDKDSNESYLNDLRLKNFTIGEAMSKRIVTVSSSDTIKMALEVLTENLFHALPVVDEGKLMGIFTTHDVLFRVLHPAKSLNA